MDPSSLQGLAIAALGAVLFVGVAVGLPSLAVVAIKFFKFKERELALEMEFRQRSQQKDVALEQRVQRLEEALTSLDHDVREKLGIKKPAAPRLDLMEGPGADPGGSDMQTTEVPALQGKKMR